MSGKIDLKILNRRGRGELPRRSRRVLELLECGDQKHTESTRALRKTASFARLGRRGRLPLRKMRRLILGVHCLHDQQEADCGQGYVDVFQEGVALEAMVEGSAQEDGGQGEGERDQVVVGDGGNPEAC